MPLVPEPAAQVSILPVQEVPLVEPPDSRERLAPGHHAGARDPVDRETLAARDALGIRTHVAPRQSGIGKEAREQGRTAEESREQRWIAASAALDTAIVVQDPRSGDGALRIAAQFFFQAVSGAR